MEEARACRAGVSLGESRRAGNGKGISSRAAKKIEIKEKKKKNKLEVVFSEATAKFLKG